MAGNSKTGSSSQTPKSSTPASTSKQRSIASFFQKPSPGSAPSPREKVAPAPHRPSSCLQETSKANALPKPRQTSSAKLSTPVPSSDALDPPSSPTGDENLDSASRPLPSPSNTATATGTSIRKAGRNIAPQAADQPSPSRKVGIPESSPAKAHAIL